MATVLYGDLEWDSKKARTNLDKHGVSFEEAAQAFTDPLSIDYDDLAHPDRLVTLAVSPRGRILYIVTTQRRGRVRVISARPATPRERREYEEEDR